MLKLELLQTTKLSTSQLHALIKTAGLPIQDDYSEADGQKILALHQQQIPPAESVPTPPSPTDLCKTEWQRGGIAASQGALKIVDHIAAGDARKARSAYLPLFMLHLGKELSDPEFAQAVETAIAQLETNGDVDHFLLSGMSSGLLPEILPQNWLEASAA